MSNLFGSQPKIIPEFTGLQINTAVQVLPIPLIYGAPRVSINLIYYNGFYSKLANTQSGKGLLSGGKGGKQLEYFATIILAIGEGPIPQVEIIYQDQEVWTPANYPTNGAFYTGGSPTQAPWSVIESMWPGDARSYKDTAYYGFYNAQLDSSATVPQIDLVVQGIMAATSPLNDTTISITTGQYDPNGKPISFIGNIHLGCLDADPAYVINDFLTDPTHGALFPANLIDATTLFTSANGYVEGIGDSALSTYCQAVGLGWSLVLNNAESANSILERWAKNLNVAIVWNGALLRFIPYRDTIATANPGWSPTNVLGIPLKYFTPNITPVATITLDQILQSEEKEEDPITFTRKDPVEVYNTVRMDFRDRFNFYNDNVAEAQDEVHIELYGPRVDNIGLANEFTFSAYANLSAYMQLRRNVAIMRTFTWKMSPLWAWLDPMDIIVIPDPANYANGIQVRITSVEDDADENVTIIAEELPVGAQSPLVLPLSPTTPPNQGATNVPPSAAVPPVIFEPPTAMLAVQGLSTPQFILGDSGAINGIFDPNWGGANIWISLDSVSYELIGTLFGPSTMGELTQALPAYGGANPDTVDTLYVNLAISNGALASVNAVAAANGHSLCAIRDASGFEILGYTTATLSTPYTYALTGLYRGLYGTTPRQFGAGSQFLFVGTNANFLEESLPSAYIGVTFWIKPQSFNIMNSAVQDLSEVVAYQYVVTGPTPPAPVAPPAMTQPPALKQTFGRRLIGTAKQGPLARPRKS